VEGIVVKDRERLRAIEERLGLSGVQAPEDLNVSQNEKTSEHDESV